VPYKSLKDLPKGVKDNLPKHGQEIYQAAFNHAFAKYCNKSDVEELAHRVAWAAVKKKYAKSADGRWQPRND